MSYGISEFGSMEYAGEDITENGNTDDLVVETNIEEFCTITCSASNV